MFRFAPRVWSLALALVFAADAVWAAYDSPVGYYSGAAGLSGAALKSALRNRIKDHVVVPYSASGATDVWDALQVLDADPGNASNVLLLYSGSSRAKTLREGSSAGNTWNREHVWPLSRGPGNANTTPGSDLFHLFACDTTVNANRAALPFDEVAFSPDPEAPLSGVGGSWWHPRDADKGVVARALFYMAVRYEAVDGVNLELGESAGNTTMGKLSTLLRWHRRFPPTEAERRRNHLIYTSYQANRNPFVDNPLFADQVFSGDTPFAAWRRPSFTTAELDNAAIAGDAADPDGDGLANRLEFAFNLAPRVAESGADLRPSLTVLAPAAPGGAPRFAFTHRRHRYATDLVFLYERSADLATWTEFTPSASSASYVDALTELVTIEAPLDGPRAYVRLRVERP